MTSRSSRCATDAGLVGRPEGRLAALRCAGTLAAVVLTSASFAAGAPIVHDGESAPAKAWRKAMETSDLAALAEMYDAGSVSFPPDKTEVKGASAIMKDYASLFARYTVTVGVADAHWTEKPPLVVSWGLTTLTLHPKAGGPDVVSRTRFTDAAVATGAGWRYLVDHASSVPTGK